MQHKIKINDKIQTIDCKVGSGLCDINKQEIYEGDIITFVRPRTNLNNSHYKVFFAKGHFFINDDNSHTIPLIDIASFAMIL